MPDFIDIWLAKPLKPNGFETDDQPVALTSENYAKLVSGSYYADKWHGIYLDGELYAVNPCGPVKLLDQEEVVAIVTANDYAREQFRKSVTRKLTYAELNVIGATNYTNLDPVGEDLKKDS